MHKKKGEKISVNRDKIKKIIQKAKLYKTEKENIAHELKRAHADFVNYKRKEAQRNIEYIDREKEIIFLKIISILDNFELATIQTKKINTSDPLIEGFLQIKEQIKMFLQNEGVIRIEAMGKHFDPHYHDAIEVVQSEEESGLVTEELQTGYIFKDKVIRPSKVKVSQ